ncbi:MAG: hypothetical protein LIP28_01855, partial [Deltaproteobacteria bacterium]|nr:hypothetical protein [Deltaproteobacteria bacterium]
LAPPAGAPGSDPVNGRRGDEGTGNLIDLGNFTDGDDDTLTVATVTINGVAVPVGAATDIGDGLTATVNADGTCTITGVSGVKPADLDKIEISVTVKDQLGAESNEGSVTLNLTDANAGPQGDAIFANDQIAAALSGTLDGLFTDPEGDTVLLTSVTFGSETKDWDGLGSISIDGEHGTLTVTNTGDATNPNYTYTYEPHDTSAPGDSDSFSFTAKDSFGEESTVDGSLNITLEGIDQNLAQGETADGTAFGWDTGVTVSGEGHNNIVGGAGDDTFTLKGSGSELHAGAGDDVITVSGSGHEVHADSGENVITVSGAGHQIYGGGDADHIDGRNGSGNFLFGGDGDDTIYAGANDTVRGGLGDDVMYSGEGETSFVWDVEDIASGGLDTIMDFSMDDKLVFDDLFSATGTFDLDDGKLVMEVSVDNGNASQTVEVHFSTSDSGYQDFVTAYTDNAGDQQAQEALVAALIKGITGS